MKNVLNQTSWSHCLIHIRNANLTEAENVTWSNLSKGSLQNPNPVKVGTLSQLGGRVADGQPHCPNCIWDLFKGSQIIGIK